AADAACRDASEFNRSSDQSNERTSTAVESNLCDLLPFLAPGRFQHSIASFLGFKRVAERGRSRFARFEPFQEIRNLMNETVLVADLETGHPPVFHVRLVAVTDMN